MKKKSSYVGLRLPEADKAALIAAAKAAGLSVSEYVRSLHRPKVAPAEPVPTSAQSSTPAKPTGSATVHRVESVGPDPLWSGKVSL